VIAALDTPFIYWARGWQVPGLPENIEDRPAGRPIVTQSSPYPQSVAQ